MTRLLSQLTPTSQINLKQNKTKQKQRQKTNQPNKQTKREKRHRGQDPIRLYQVSDDTNIKHISMSWFPSHEQTKADLTEYLAEKNTEVQQRFLKGDHCFSSWSYRSKRNLHFDDNYEEADALMICLAINASQRSPSGAEIYDLLSRYRRFIIGHSKLPSTSKHHISVIGIRNCAGTPYRYVVCPQTGWRKGKGLHMPSQEQMILEIFLNRQENLV